MCLWHCTDGMKFYCTAGRGTEEFVSKELLKVFGSDTKITSTDGKTYFDVKVSHQDIKPKLLSLKTVERVFIEVIHESYAKLDRRGLLTLLHTKLRDQSDWKECITTLNKVNGTSLQVHKDNHIKEVTCEAVCNDNKAEDDSSVACKRRKVDATATFRVSCRFSGFPRKQLHLQKTSQQMGVLISKLLGWKIDLRHPKYEVNINLSDDRLTVGIPITSIPLSKRSYIKHCGLRTPVAWIMAKLLDIAPGDVVLDPLCGTGTILVEASQICQEAVYIGVDNDMSQLKLAVENVEYNTQNKGISLLHGDTRQLPLHDNSVNKAVTDAPFGLIHTVPGELQMFYCRFLKEISRIVKPAGKIVVLTSTDIAPFIQQACEKCELKRDDHASQSPYSPTTSLPDGNETNAIPQETGGNDAKTGALDKTYERHNTNTNFSLSGYLQVEKTYNVKLGETEGCIFVMLNSEKLE